MKLLVTTYMVDEYKEVFEKMFDEVHYKGMMELGRLLTEDELAEALQGMDAVVIEFDPLSRKVLEQAKDLKIILSVRGGAHANIDVEAATEMGIPTVSYTHLDVYKRQRKSFPVGTSRRWLLEKRLRQTPKYYCWMNLRAELT